MDGIFNVNPAYNTIISKVFYTFGKKYFTLCKKYVTLLIEEVNDMPLNQERKISNRIVILRAERGLSQRELADQLGVSRQTIISLEKNRYNPSLKLAFDIALFFNVDLQEVFQYELEDDK